jgi:hypothetical protein
VVNVKVNAFWDRDISQPGHAAVLVRASGDNYKSVSVQCWGSAHPYAVENGDAEDDCGWTGATIRPGRWQEKHVSEAFERHVAYVVERGPIRHGAEGSYPDVCRCSPCRLQVPPSTTAPYAGGAADA